MDRVTSPANQTVEKTYAFITQDSPVGAPQLVQLGSSPALYQYARYNGRLQLSDVKLGTSITYTDAAPSPGLLCLVYNGALEVWVLNLKTWMDIKAMRGNFRRDVFFDDEDRKTYLGLLLAIEACCLDCRAREGGLDDGGLSRGA